MFPGAGAGLRRPSSVLTVKFTVAAIALMVVAAALAASGATASAQSGAPTEISGRVVNGTPGSEVPPGLQVVLLTVDEAAGTIIDRKQMPAGANGEFRFTNLLSGPGLTYRVVADNGDHTPSVDLTPGESAFTGVEVTIYDSTTSFDDIRISSFAMLVPSIDGAGRIMGVMAVANIVNAGDRVWIPDLDNPALTGLDLFRFNLPEGFTDLSVESDLPTGNILQIGTGFAMTNPIPPGDYNLLMSYIIEYDGDSLEFPLRLPYGADQVRIMLPEGAGTVRGQGFGPSDGVIIDETAYSMVQGSDYARDSELNVRITGLPSPTTVQSLTNFFRGKSYIVAIIWVAAAALLGMLFYAFIFSRQRQNAAAMIPALAGGVSPSFPEYDGMPRSEIVQAIAELDDRHDAGDIDEDEYRSRRGVLKSAALDTGSEGSGPG